MKLLGIFIDKRSKQVAKVLKPGWFPFGAYLLPKEDGLVISGKMPLSCVDVYTNGGISVQEIVSAKNWGGYGLNHYSVRHVSGLKGPDISISAIVGKNGAGKSTLLDILFRIINNFTIWCIGNRASNNSFRHLSKAYGVYADLYFEVKGKQYKISCRNLKVEFFKENNKQFVQVHKDDWGKTRLLLNSFFYTIVVNYSLYAYNTDEYANELVDELPKGKSNEKWIDGLFHKNDGYFTPIVLTPYRQKGSIDIIKENDLAEQRIIRLALLAEANNRTFIENYTPDKLRYGIRKGFREKLMRELNEELASDGIDIRRFNIEIVLDIFQQLWKRILFEEKDIDREILSDERVKLGILYLSVKSLKIGLRYPDYRNKFQIDKDIRAIENGELTENNYFDQLFPNRVTGLIDKIRRYSLLSSLEQNHITLKIAQTERFIKGLIRGNGFQWLNEGVINVNDILNGKRLKTYSEVIMLLPPPFYEIHLDFVSKGNREDDEQSSWMSLTGDSFNISRMSSGERHLLNCMSNILYHLKNIESIEPDKDRLKYKHVCIVFDEVELYFHPEYQRKFIKMLLEALNWCNFRKGAISSIQILIVTHSPFILTDIFTQNTLYLDNGESKTVNTQTFGANYYDILNNSFFFRDSSVGEISTDFIRRLAESLRIEHINLKGLEKYLGDRFIVHYLKTLSERETKQD